MSPLTHSEPILYTHAVHLSGLWHNYEHLQKINVGRDLLVVTLILLLQQSSRIKESKERVFDDPQ